MKRNRKQLQVLFPAKTRDLSGTLVSLFYALAAFPPYYQPYHKRTCLLFTNNLKRKRNERRRNRQWNRRTCLLSTPLRRQQFARVKSSLRSLNP